MWQNEGSVAHDSTGQPAAQLCDSYFALICERHGSQRPSSDYIHAINHRKTLCGRINHVHPTRKRAIINIAQLPFTQPPPSATPMIMTMAPIAMPFLRPYVSETQPKINCTATSAISFHQYSIPEVTVAYLTK